MMRAGCRPSMVFMPCSAHPSQQRPSAKYQQRKMKGINDNLTLTAPMIQMTRLTTMKGSHRLGAEEEEQGVNVASAVICAGDSEVDVVIVIVGSVGSEVVRGVVSPFLSPLFLHEYEIMY